MGVIENFIKNYEEHLPDICHGARAAYKNLSQHYAATNNSPIYSVATAIHAARHFQYWFDQIWGTKSKIASRRSSKEHGRIIYVNEHSIRRDVPSLAPINSSMMWTSGSTSLSHSLFSNHYVRVNLILATHQNQPFQALLWRRVATSN